MLEAVARFSLLAFGIPGFAPDEHLSGTQPNDWSHLEQHPTKRREEPSVSALPHKDTSVRAGKPARRNRVFRCRTRCNQSGSVGFRRRFHRGTFFIGSRRAGLSSNRFRLPTGAFHSEKRASVNPHSVFLRNGCILPDRLDPVRDPVCENWSVVAEITSPVLDTMIRRMGWHFLSVLRPFRRRGFGAKEADATRRALAGALKSVARQYNAADLVSVQARRYPGFYVAVVILQPRQIQQFTSLEIAADWQRMIAPTR
jgi:hypothetical protein